MKILKYILLSAVGLLVIAAVVGLFLPDRVHLERSTTVNAPPQVVFALANDFQEFNKWSPWFKRDPDAEYRFEGPGSGVGSKMIWRSEKPDVGSGSQEIVESDPDRLVRTYLDFGAQGTADASITIQPEGDGSRVIWGFDSEFGYNLIGRYFGLFFEQMLGPDYEQGLANLKQLAEASQ